LKSIEKIAHNCPYWGLPQKTVSKLGRTERRPREPSSTATHYIARYISLDLYR
jgi:hypothetical protein